MNKSQIYNIIISYIQKKEFIILSKPQLRYIINEIDQLTNTELHKNNIKNTIKILITKIINKIHDQTKLDNKNYQLKLLSTVNKPIEVQISKFLGNDKYDDFLSTIIPEQYYKRYYIIFDSKNKSRDNIKNNILHWNYIPNKQISSNSVTTAGSISNIISMKIYNIIMPKLDLNNLNWQPNISISIKELETQSVLVKDNLNYHFIGRLLNPTEEFMWNVYFEDNTYNFYTPIKFIDSFTIQFKNPDEDLILNNDIITATITYGNPTILNCNENHNSLTNHYIYISSFNTNSPEADINIINQMNKKEGHICTVIDNETLSIDIDTTNIDQIDDLEVDIYLESQRILIPMEFTCLE